MTSWRPTSGGRTPMVTCVSCGRSEINESNRLRRADWQESIGSKRVFRCGQCADAVEMEAMVASEQGITYANDDSRH